MLLHPTIQSTRLDQQQLPTRDYDDCRRTEPSAVATRHLGAELWDRSIAWVDLPH